MGTPTFVKFSRISGTPAEVFARLGDEVFHPLQIRPTEVAPLRHSSDPFDAGLAEVGQRSPCETMDALVELIEHQTLFGTVHLVPYVPAYLYFHIFGVKPDSFSLTMSFDASILSYESVRFEKGEWIRNFLISLVGGLNTPVCGYGSDPAYEIEYESLSPEAVVGRLQSGSLLEIWYPTFHAISTDLISVQEVQALVDGRRVTLATEALEYQVAITGYHILSILP